MTAVPFLPAPYAEDAASGTAAEVQMRNAADHAVSLWYSCFIYVPSIPVSSLPLSFVILPKGWHFHESDGNAGSTGIIHARTDTILSYVYFTGNGRI